MDSSLSQCCRYSSRSCENKPLVGYQYCKLHILEDKGSNFSQCPYRSVKTGRRCHKAAQKLELDSLCSLHARGRTQLSGHNESHNWETVTPEILLTELSQLANSEGPSTDEPSAAGLDETSRQYESQAADTDSEIVESREAQTSAYIQESDSESLDSENEDPFKYAEILTQEEVTRLTRDKLIRLQSLYIEQFKWLQHSLRESRARYLGDLRQISVDDEEKDMTSAKSNGRLTTRLSTRTEHGQLYRAARRYHRKHGREALLYEKCQERRRQAAGLGVTQGADASRNRSRSLNHCANKNSKCQEVALPMSKYCLKHIDGDMHQVLYRPCSFSCGSERFSCRRPVVNLYQGSRCGRHTNMSDLAGFSGSPAQSRPQSLVDSHNQSYSLDVDNINILESMESVNIEDLDKAMELEVIPIDDLESVSKELEAVPISDLEAVSKELENLPVEELEDVSKELETLSSRNTSDANLAKADCAKELETNTDCGTPMHVGEPAVLLTQSRDGGTSNQ